jgi:hypothetical protein
MTPGNFPIVKEHLATLLVVRGCQARALWALWTFEEALVLLAGMWWFEPLLPELSSFYAAQTTTIERL